MIKKLVNRFRWNRVGKCYGFPLWVSKSTNIELWFCFAEVGRHRHDEQNSIIIPLFGWSKFSKIENYEIKTMHITPRSWFHSFRIPAGMFHWFYGVPLVFLNISDRPVSAGKNIQYT